MTREELDDVMDVRKFIGRAPEQVVEFIAEYIDPVLNRHRDRLGIISDVRV